MIQVENKGSTLNRIVFFSIMFLANSFAITNDVISSGGTIFLWCATLVLIIYDTHTINKELFWVYVVTAICMFMTTILNQENMRTAVVILFSYFVALIFVQKVDLHSFVDVYIDVMCFLSVISLVFFLIYLLFPGMQEINTVINKAGKLYSNLYIYVDTKHYTRNMGMYWEPGAYQTFLNIAMALEVMKRNYSIKKVILLVVTVITTYSTTGYLATLLIFLIIYCKKEEVTSNRKMLFAFFLVLILIIAYFYQDVLIGRSLSNGQQTVFGKIVNFSDDGMSSSSASVRYNGIFAPVREFLKKPLFGNGYEGLRTATFEYTRGMNTCTFINWFAVYGVVFGGLMFLGIKKFADIFAAQMLVRILLILLLFVATMSENYVNDPILFVLVLYGFKGTRSVPGEIVYENL